MLRLVSFRDLVASLEIPSYFLDKDSTQIHTKKSDEKYKKITNYMRIKRKYSMKTLFLVRRRKKNLSECENRVY